MRVTYGAIFTAGFVRLVVDAGSGGGSSSRLDVSDTAQLITELQAALGKAQEFRHANGEQCGAPACKCAVERRCWTAYDHKGHVVVAGGRVAYRCRGHQLP